MVLYGAPIWAKGDLLSRQNIKALRSAQRRIAIRAIRAYRTVSSEAAMPSLAWYRSTILRRLTQRCIAVPGRKPGRPTAGNKGGASTASETTGPLLRMA